MVDTYSPLGTDGFEFVEYTAVDHKGIEQLKRCLCHLVLLRSPKHHFKRLGCIDKVTSTLSSMNSLTAKRQRFASAWAIGLWRNFRVNEATAAMEQAFKGRWVKSTGQVGPMELSIPAITASVKACSILWIVMASRASMTSISDFMTMRNSAWPKPMLAYEIDHLTHNVKQGNMDDVQFGVSMNVLKQLPWDSLLRHWRQADRPCEPRHDLTVWQIRSINESSDDKSQIEEFIRAKLQRQKVSNTHPHSPPMTSTKPWELCVDRGMDFMPTPDTYYEKKLTIVWKATVKTLICCATCVFWLMAHRPKTASHLQIFTQTVIGPVFFEIIPLA